MTDNTTPRTAIMTTLLAQTSAGWNDDDLDALLDVNKSATVNAALSRNGGLLDWDEYREVSL